MSGLEDYYGMQATAQQNPYLPSGPVPLSEWVSQQQGAGLEQSFNRGTHGFDTGDGLYNPVLGNSFRLPDGNWLKPTVQNGMVTGTRAENIGLGERMRDGVESMAPFLAVAGTAGALGHLGVGSGLGAGGASAAPASMAGGIDAAVSAGAGATSAMGSLPGAAASGGGLLSGLGSAIGGSGLNLGGVIGGIGSAIDAYNTPDTLTTTSTNSLSPEAQGHMNSLISMAQDRMGQQSAQNPFASQDNPYLQGMIDSGISDLSRAYQANRTSAETSAARGNAFGSGRFGLTAQQNLDSFGTAAGNMTNAMRFGDYNQRAQLTESGLNRDFQRDQQNMSNYQNAVRDNANLNRVSTTQGQNPAAGNPWSAGLGGYLTGSALFNGWSGR